MVRKTLWCCLCLNQRELCPVWQRGWKGILNKFMPFSCFFFPASQKKGENDNIAGSLSLWVQARLSNVHRLSSFVIIKLWNWCKEERQPVLMPSQRTEARHAGVLHYDCRGRTPAQSGCVTVRVKFTETAIKKSKQLWRDVVVCQTLFSSEQKRASLFSSFEVTFLKWFKL